MTKVNEKVKEIAQDIKRMKIRGAGKIARSAAEALLITAQQSKARKSSTLVKELETSAKLLLSTRPTAVSLPNSIRYIMFRVREAQKRNVKLEDLRSLVVKTATEFIQNSENAVKHIGEIGARRIEDGDFIMTHCNSAAVTAVLKTAFNQGKRFKVFVCETRPRFQGRITAKALSNVGIPTSLIVDGATRFFMAKMDKAIVGADAVAANGAVVNKIGTSMVALAAHESRVLFFVAAETYKFSPETMLGQLVKIEERGSSEILSEKALKRIPNVTVRNPSFDITPPEYIDLIVTERGIIPPQAAIMIIQDEFGSITAEELMEYQIYHLADEDEP
ncbi:MAG: ribose 1,5-bisphosphate isomerase [Candidatus Bathyarchaeota archaeon]|nr:ribose 1,5-bisphosphate isomerase [Candidatus Bathyarchaeota archaeon]MDH5494278.1 ribose 1,5-bisphosphate isomerase [Candidatus Bathyarchaeota archaeon]